MLVSGRNYRFKTRYFLFELLSDIFHSYHKRDHQVFSVVYFSPIVSAQNRGIEKIILKIIALHLVFIPSIKAFIKNFSRQFLARYFRRGLDDQKSSSPNCSVELDLSLYHKRNMAGFEICSESIGVK